MTPPMSKKFPRIALGVFLDRWLGRQWDPGIVIGDVQPVELTPLQRAKFTLARDIVARQPAPVQTVTWGICIDCRRAVDLTQHGECPGCGSAVLPATLSS